ncbi:MAG: hypothetical protein GY850_19380, partial [bacterium]|nr:hypothetical protein [bacterium]
TGPGQNNEGWGLLAVANAQENFMLPTRTAETPHGADVHMDRAAISLQVDGVWVSDDARVTREQVTPLRVCVETDQTQTGYHHVMIFDGEPGNGGELLRHKLLPGIGRDQENCVFVQNFFFDESGSKELFAHVLEAREDALRANNYDGLRVHVEPIPEIEATRAFGNASKVNAHGDRGSLSIFARFPFDGELELSESVVVISELLDETRGAGELIPAVGELTGQDLTLYANKATNKWVRFATPKGQKPSVKLDVWRHRGELYTRLSVKKADIVEPDRCGRDDRTRLGTKLVLEDHENAPVALLLDDVSWRCKRNRKGDVTRLWLFEW